MPTKSSLQHFVTMNNKKHFYTLKPVGKKTTHINCESAHVDQEFLNEDVPSFLYDLPNLILAEKEYQENQEAVIRFRVSSEDKRQIEEKAIKKGFKSVSEFLRKVALAS